MAKLSKLFITLIITLSAIGGLVVATPTPAAAASKKCNEYILTFPAWYRGLLDGNCELETPGQSETGITRFIWKIVLNIVDMILQLVGYASVIFLIIGGFRYMTATGDASKMTAAKGTVANAIIGLVIALASVAIVNTIAGVI